MKTTIPTLVIIAAILIVFFSFILDKKDIVRPEDLRVSLNNRDHTNNLNEEIAFWSDKLLKDVNCLPCKLKIAGSLSQRFKSNYNPSDLRASDSILKSLLNQQLSLATVYHSLAGNAITQHKFQEAWTYAQEALSIGEQKDQTYYLLFDVALELGYLEQSSVFLNKHNNKNTFDYLLRASKLEDKYGNLDKAIELMETAALRVKDNKKLSVWALSNLADMYGHAGKVGKSYDYYLKVLQLDSDHSHSKKGLAWIAFSEDRNTEIARVILKEISERNADPQLTLLMAEIADFDGSIELSSLLKKDYYNKVSLPIYGDMYNKYLILLDAENRATSQRAVQKARAELKKRSTTEVYDLLAWSLLKNHQKEEALKIANQFVIGNSSEPEVLFHLGLIYHENGMKKQSQKYLKDALTSSFELGPLVADEIKIALAE